MGIVGALLGCDKREPLGGSYYFNETEHVIQYRYDVGGSLQWHYRNLDSADRETFKVFSKVYATDKERVYFTGKQVKGVHPNGFKIVEAFPNSFAKNTLGEQILFGDSLLAIDYNSAKIHSKNYVSDKNKVIFIAHGVVYKFGLFHEVPVADPPSFQQFKIKSRNSKAIGYDKHYLYIDGINTKIPSANAQIIQLGFPTIILQKDVLHYVYSSQENVSIFKALQAPFNLSAHSHIASFMYDDFYHFSIQGLKQAKQIAQSCWITDQNGLYFIDDNEIHKISDQQFEQYTYAEEYPKYLRTNDSLFQFLPYPHNQVIRYTTAAEIIEKEIVKDQNNIYLEGEEVKNVDIETFVQLKNGRFVDRNFYYYDNLSHRKPIPDWAYEEFVEGKITENKLFGIFLGYEYTIYRSYWNGFLVILSLPSKQNDTAEVLLEFRNIARKPIQLNCPLEEQFYISYQPHRTEDHYYQDQSLLKGETEYDFSNINAKDTIRFSFPLNQALIKRETIIRNEHPVLPQLILSSKKIAKDHDDYDLYINAVITPYEKVDEY